MSNASPQNLNHIYVHYPYCLYKCHYCDFNSYAIEKKEIPENEYLKNLILELEFWHEKLGRNHFPIQTVFFGGGTPSLMDPKSVETVLQKIDDLFGCADNVEVTLESNPGTVTQKSFAAFKSAGVNRVSLGVQSFAEKNLSRFGRIHTGDEALKALENALFVFENVSADLIFGFPSQSLNEWQQDLQTLTALSLPHMSCYALTAEPHTQYTVDLKKKKYQETTAETFADMQLYTYSFLESQGYHAYEISNFAKPGAESQHNLGYWRYHSYLGIGAGAISNWVWDAHKVERFANRRRPQDYEEALYQQNDFFTREEVVSPDILIEFFMMNLRLKNGVTEQQVTRFFNDQQASQIFEIFAKLVAEGYVERVRDRFQITQKGFLLNHKMLAYFLD